MRRLGAATLILSVPGAAQQFRTVPEDYWSWHYDPKNPGYKRANFKMRVECPCGNRPVLAKGEFSECRAKAANPGRCDRRFLALRESVLVYGGPKQHGCASHACPGKGSN